MFESIKNVPERKNEFTPEQARFFSLHERNILGTLVDEVKKLPEFIACEGIFKKYAAKFGGYPEDEALGWVSKIARAYLDGRKYTTTDLSVFGKKEAAEALVKLANSLGFSAHTELKYPGNTGYIFVLDV